MRNNEGDEHADECDDRASVIVGADRIEDRPPRGGICGSRCCKEDKDPWYQEANPPDELTVRIIRTIVYIARRRSAVRLRIAGTRQVDHDARARSPNRGRIITMQKTLPIVQLSHRFSG